MCDVNSRPRTTRETSVLTTPFGELVAAVFDEVAAYSTDPREVNRLAVVALMHIVRGTPLPVGRARPEGRAS